MGRIPADLMGGLGLRDVTLCFNDWCGAQVMITDDVPYRQCLTVVLRGLQRHIAPGSPSGFMNEPIDLAQKLALFEERFSPRVVATMNDYKIEVVKVEGEFVWHSHPDTDDFFLVLEGELEIELRDRKVQLRKGELFVVPRGVEHRPRARDEAHILLIEPQGTPNTGDAVDSELTAVERTI